jgi:hypothetical protein
VNTFNSRLSDIEEEAKITPKPLGQRSRDDESAEKFNDEEDFL